eukprot:812813-Pelagomonas_calceolata.AAC.6
MVRRHGCAMEATPAPYSDSETSTWAHYSPSCPAVCWCLPSCVARFSKKIDKVVLPLPSHSFCFKDRTSYKPQVFRSAALADSMEKLFRVMHFLALGLAVAHHLHVWLKLCHLCAQGTCNFDCTTKPAARSLATSET